MDEGVNGWPQYTLTLAVHTGERAERVSYTRISRWWKFDVRLGGTWRCFSWRYDEA